MHGTIAVFVHSLFVERRIVLIRVSRIPVEASLKFCQPCRNLADTTTHSLVHFVFISRDVVRGVRQTEYER
jgi:hypothetical protein